MLFIVFYLFYKNIVPLLTSTNDLTGFEIYESITIEKNKSLVLVKSGTIFL